MPVAYADSCIAFAIQTSCNLYSKFNPQQITSKIKNEEKEIAVIISKFNGKVFSSSFIMVLFLAIFSFAQDSPKSTVIYNQEKKQWSVAERNNVYCAGYIQTAPINTNFELVGAKDENEQFLYSQNQFVYVNQGSGNGVKVGDTFSVVRPRGQVKTKFSEKGKLGHFVQEVGSVEIIRVRSNVSVAKVKNSCDNFLMGDLLQPMETRSVPVSKARPALDHFAESNGKTVGRIIFGRENREVFGRDQIVYIDLGAEDSVKIGDYLTIFRPLGKGGILNLYDEETVNPQDSDYGSETFQGSPYSSMSQRKAGETAEGKVVTTKNAKTRRPTGLRKVVGDMIILNVKEKTATALILRNAQEIHNGDFVEIQ